MAKSNKATSTARVLPAINKPAQSNEPADLNKHLSNIKVTLVDAIHGKRNFDKGFAKSVGNMFELIQDGYFEHTSSDKGQRGLVQLVEALNNGSTESAAGVMEEMCNRLGLYKVMPEIIEPEKRSKKTFGSDAQGYKEYQDKMNTWKRAYTPLKTMLSRVIVVSAYLSDPKRRQLVNIIKTSTNKNEVGCVYLNGELYSTDKHLNRYIVPYNKACSELEDMAKKQFNLKRRTGQTQSSDAVSIKRAFEVMQSAIKHDGSNLRSQNLLCNAMRAVKNGLETMEVTWNNTNATFRTEVRDLLYTLLSSQHGLVAQDVANEAFKTLEKYEPPKEEQVKTMEEAKDRAANRETEQLLDKTEQATS